MISFIISSLIKISDKINKILDYHFNDFYNSLNKFEVKKYVSGWLEEGIEDWFRANRNGKLRFVKDENKKFDLFYIIFKFCDMLFINDEQSKNIEHTVLRYIILNLKTGIKVLPEHRKKSLFYHNVNFLILLLNYSPLVKNNNNKPLIFILDLIKNIHTYKKDFKNPLDEEYFNLNKRFNFEIQGETNNEKKEIESPKTEEFIEKVIKNYKYKDVIDFGLQLNNLKNL